MTRRGLLAGAALAATPGLAVAAPRYDAVLKRADDPRRFAAPTFARLSEAVAAAPAREPGRSGSWSRAACGTNRS
jgi:pectinesterase